MENPSKWMLVDRFLGCRKSALHLKKAFLPVREELIRVYLLSAIATVVLEALDVQDALLQALAAIVYEVLHFRKLIRSHFV
jgi:hypothetical protein